MNRKFTIRISFLFLGLCFFPATSFCTNHLVSVQNYSFSPSTVNASVGDTVTWQWVSGSHTTTCNGTFPGTSLPPGATAWSQNINASSTTFSYVIAVDGEYDYVCMNHAPGMAGVIIATALPVELVSFRGTLNGNEVTLNWQTATEKNNNGFEIQRKISNNWEKIGFVPGHGTTLEKNYYSFKDNINNLPDGNLYYRLKQVDFSGSFEYSLEIVINKTVPSEFSLSQNYPNPFNPSTLISYSIPVNANVSLKIYDAVGNEVTTLVNERQESGTYQVVFNASRLASGIYYYTITAGSFTASKKMILMK
jgi:plastocyanin